ncbi:urease accessory protein UreF [Streptomyces sp. NPDC004069]
MNAQNAQDTRNTREPEDRQPQTMLPALLLLADGRFPSGGHAHSGGLEAAAALDGVRDLAALEEFLRGRLATTGVVTAAFTAAACAAFGGTDRRGPDTDAALEALETLETLDHEFAARTPSPALRTASRRLGRQLLRAARTIWPHPRLDELSAAPRHGPHQPVALGAVAAAAGLGPDAAALAAAHDAVLTPATAAVRLLGLDPFAVHAAVARLGPRIAAVAAEAADHAHTAPAALPSRAGPLLDIRAEHHAAWEVRLFAS